MRSYPTLLLALPLMVTGMGCASTEQARYVYQDREFGVVGIPANTDRWPNHYRTQADRLMQRHFPEGHEIVRAEEVVEEHRRASARTADRPPQNRQARPCRQAEPGGHLEDQGMPDHLSTGAKAGGIREQLRRTPRADSNAIR
jgi:hypothetical protein